MAGYIFAIAKEKWNDMCRESIVKGYFTPYTPEIEKGLLEKDRTRKSRNKTLAAIFGDFVTMHEGDNVYFLSNRKIYGIGKLKNIGKDCKYDNYLDSSALLPDCNISIVGALASEDTRARWICLFEPSPYFFKKGVDMDDVLKFRPSAFKMLRAFQDLSFIKIDDEENRALREFISLKNEMAYLDIEQKTFMFDKSFHENLSKRDLSTHILDINKVLKDYENQEYVKSEMFIEAALLQALSRNECEFIGNWDYLTHQLIASPFKPLSYIDKIDIYGYCFSEHYQDKPELITKYLLIELKFGKINKAAVEQTMQYVDWICSEYASGDYSRIDAFIVGNSTVRNIDDIVENKCQRDYIVETHPAKSEKWRNLHLIKYKISEKKVLFEDM